MKWNSIPILEDGRVTITEFLIFPKCINGEWRWLEKATYITYRNWNYYTDSYFYHDIEWIDKGKPVAGGI